MSNDDVGIFSGNIAWNKQKWRKRDLGVGINHGKLGKWHESSWVNEINAKGCEQGTAD